MADASPPIRACVVMTACIAPAATHLLHRVDPRVRLDDYLAALRFWLDVPDPRVASILIAENSGAPLDALRVLAASHNPRGRRVEIDAFGDNVIPDGISYGYPELTMLDDAAERSSLWRDAGTTHLIKATGRLTFPRIARLLDRTPAGVAFMADARDRRLPRRRARDGGVLSTQLMLFTPAFYRAHLAGLRHRMRPQPGWRLIENVLYRELFDLRDDPAVRFRFPVNCPPAGQAGAWHKSYDAPRERVQNAARAIARVATPWWWV